MTSSRRAHPVLPLLALAFFLTLPGAADAAENGNSARRYQPATPAGFDCREAGSPTQDFICASDTLTALDRETATLFHQQLQRADLFGRDQLIAGQHRWLAGRPSRCNVPAARQTAEHPDPAVSACLEASYRERLAALRQWQPAQRSQKPDSDHPVSAYVQFRPADVQDAALCERFQNQMNALIKAEGQLNPGRLPGARLVAGSHGTAEAQQPPHQAQSISVAQRDAGPYGSFETRAIGLSMNGARLIDENTLGRWIGEQPNFGGRPNTLSSQTNDYGSIDAFTQNGTLLALVMETWGYYSPAASGESAYAGLYAVDGGSAQRRCLFKTYQRPPVHGAFDALPNYLALRDALDAIGAEESSGLDGSDRQAEDLLRREQDWQLLHLPMLQIIEARQFGWTPWLRRRHDITLDRLFLWSETRLQAKQHYRTLLPLLKPAQTEVAQAMRETQGITAEEAAQAADLLLMEMLDHALGTRVDNGEAYSTGVTAPSAPGKYTPRFPVAPERAQLEKGRGIATLYSAVLNRLPAKAVADYLAWEATHPEKRSFGDQGETALMAAVTSPETVSQLLAAGADANETDRNGVTPLMLAARYGRAESLTRLLDAGATLEAETRDLPTSQDEPTEVQRARIGGKTALYFAAASGDASSVHTLLDRGAAILHRDGYGALPCDAVKLNTHLAEAERDALIPRLCPPRPAATSTPPTARREAASALNTEFAAVQRPILTVGDRWKLETRIKASGRLKESLDMVVTEIAGEQLRLTINGSPGAMTADLGALDGPQMRYEDGNLQLLAFPLTPGKRWSFKTGWDHKASGAKGRLQLEVTVRGLERIKLASAKGGDVEAVRLDAQGLANVTSPIRLMRRLAATYWYAPTLRCIVRSEWNDGAEETVTELVEASSQ